ncbi:hypothetical protein [Bradyrhizobium sp. LMTR 3]|uniref:hypothetical protein n=1 Tax=Bradyrhizobium sp. LMTR 3 TaxID=189873 RepID=UPI001147951D|nr:hypothetical protein [Bradyrhizobium sp. LMTR 3]
MVLPTVVGIALFECKGTRRRHSGSAMHKVEKAEQDGSGDTKAVPDQVPDESAAMTKHLLTPSPKGYEG